MKHRIERRGLLAVAAALALVACGSDATGPTVESLVGVYGAHEFTVTTAEGTTDILAQGGYLDLILQANGVVTGELFAPGGEEDGSDLTRDMAGTWSLDGKTVRFDQDADSFVRDTPFIVKDQSLIGEATFGGATVRVVLMPLCIDNCPD